MSRGHEGEVKQPGQCAVVRALKEICSQGRSLRGDNVINYKVKLYTNLRQE